MLGHVPVDVADVVDVREHPFRWCLDVDRLSDHDHRHRPSVDFALLYRRSGQNPNDSPVVMKKSERVAGPANSVPSPTSQTTRGVSWNRKPTSVPTMFGWPRSRDCSVKTSPTSVARVNFGAPTG